ncbi:MAG: tRNA glutamyl-Q(34) synthetase GluQRS, partial [Alphaproteobacteria bacterium]
AFSALFAWSHARAAGGRFLLRIEDIDAGRCREEFVDGILEDLAWLGLSWEEPVRRQSRHMGDYAGALARLDALGVLYPCVCTRGDIAAEIARAGGAPHGPDGPVYPGICRGMAPGERTRRIASGEGHALRLDVAKALALRGPLSWRDERAGIVAADPLALGDVVLARKETPASYHLAVVLDDHLQGVTLVTRGEDLFHATHVHRLLQALLGLSVPRWHHHALLRAADGTRLAKREGAPTLASMREAGMDPAGLRRELGFP